MSDRIYDDEKGVGYEGQEKDVSVRAEPLYDHDGPVEFAEKADLRRGLHQRHIQVRRHALLHSRCQLTRTR